MVRPTTVMAGVNLLLNMQQHSDEQNAGSGSGSGDDGDSNGQQGGQDGQQNGSSGTGQGSNGAATDGGQTEQALHELIEQQRVTSPSPSDRDAFASAVIELQAGETAEVVVEPLDGYTLRVSEIAFDRRTDHSYTLNVAGDVTSVSNRARYAKPKPVKQSDRVIAEVTNESGSSSTLDFELKAWAEKGKGM